MNIFLKADNERIFGVPFQVEQLTVAGRTQVYKLILNTEHTELPFHQIIFTLPYADEFEQVLNMDDQHYMQQLMIDIEHLKLCVNTFCKCEYCGSQFFEIAESEYVQAGMRC